MLLKDNMFLRNCGTVVMTYGFWKYLIFIGVLIFVYLDAKNFEKIVVSFIIFLIGQNLLGTVLVSAILWMYLYFGFYHNSGVPYSNPLEGAEREVGEKNT
jgi:hypothetical protein